MSPARGGPYNASSGTTSDTASLANASLACGARRNTTGIDAELETGTRVDEAAPSGPTQALASQ